MWMQLSTFDGDISHLSSNSSSSGGGADDSADQSSSSANDSLADISASAISEFSQFAPSPAPQQQFGHARRAGASGAAAASGGAVLSPSPTAPAPSASAGAAKPSSSRERSASRRRGDRDAEKEGDLRMRYDQLKKNFRKQGEELDKTTKQSAEQQGARLMWAQRMMSIASACTHLMAVCVLCCALDSMI